MAEELKLVKVLDFGGSEQYVINATKLNDRDDYVTRDELAADLAKGVRYMGTLPRTVDGAKVYTTPAAVRGDLYIVTEDCQINGIDCDPRDWWLCVADEVAEGTSNGWDRVQGDIDLDALDDKYADANHTHGITTELDGGHTPSGTVSAPTFTGTAATLKHNASVSGTEHTHGVTSSAKTLEHQVTKADVTASGSYTPAGTVTVTHTPAGNVTVAGHSHTVSFSQSEGTHEHDVTASGKYTPGGGVVVTADGNTNYTPAGTIGKAGGHDHEFVGNSIKYTPAGAADSNGAHEHDVTASGEYTPVGAVKYDQVTGITLDTTSAKVATGVETKDTNNNALAYAKYEPTTQTLSFGKFAALTDVSLATDNLTIPNAATPIYGIADGTFTGTKATINVTGKAASAGAHGHAFSGTEATLDVTGTVKPAADHDHTFSGTATVLAGVFTGTEGTVNVTGKAASAGAHKHVSGTTNNIVATASFEGTPMSETFDINGTTATITVKGTADIVIEDHSITTVDSVNAATPVISVAIEDHDYTPAGTVSAPTFTGDAVAPHTHTASASTPV